MRVAALFTVLVLAACVAPGPPGTVRAVQLQADTPAERVRAFIAVIDAVEPVAEALCRQRGVAKRCDLQIVVDTRPGLPPNAFQTVDPQGRPFVGFTLALIAQAQNADELAFVLGHEAGHHIAGHIPKQRDQVMSEALLAGVQARAMGLRAKL